MRAGDIMTRKVVTIGEHATLAAAAGLLGTDPESTLHVLDDAGHLVGLVTAAHLLDRLRPLLLAATDVVDPRDTVSDAMTAPVLAVRAATDVRHVAAALSDAGTCAVPVVDGFTLIGTVTRLDLVRALTDGRPAPPTSGSTQ